MLTGVALLLLLLLVLLAIPITLSFSLSWHQGLQGDIRLHWLFGLVRIPVSLTQSSTSSISSKEAKQSSKPSHSSAKNTNSFFVMRQKPFRQRMFRFIGDIWRAIGKKDLMLHLHLGLGDPADTGQLWAFIGPMAGMLATAQETSINVVPDFLEETFELDSGGEIRLVPLQVLYLITGLLLSPTVWRAFKDSRIG